MGQEGALHQVWIGLGPVEITGSVVFTWLILAVLGLVGYLASRVFSTTPGVLQSMLEGAVLAMADAIEGILPGKSDMVLPFVGTLWVFVVVANLSGLVPGLDSPTADLSVTSALAILVFCSVHWFGIRAVGWKAYLHHYLAPNPLLLPFHVIGEVTRTLALALRLFGNIMSMEFAALLLLTIIGLAAPLPILMLHIVEALVQAYIFGALALVYIASGISTGEERIQKQGTP